MAKMVYFSFVHSHLVYGIEIMETHIRNLWAKWYLITRFYVYYKTPLLIHV